MNRHRFAYCGELLDNAARTVSTENIVGRRRLRPAWCDDVIVFDEEELRRKRARSWLVPRGAILGFLIAVAVELLFVFAVTRVGATFTAAVVTLGGAAEVAFIVFLVYGIVKNPDDREQRSFRVGILIGHGIAVVLTLLLIALCVATVKTLV